MTNKFANIPADLDTRIIEQKAVKVGDYDAFYQKWSWDGIVAESLIFVSNEVALLNDDALKTLVRGSYYYQSSTITLKRSSGGYCFTNFNFRS